MMNFILCAITLLGFYNAAIIFLRIPSAFSPIFTISCIGLILYFSALAQHLAFTLTVLTYLGLLFFVITLCKNIFFSHDQHAIADNTKYLILIISAAALTLTGTHILRYPDETHFWGPLTYFIDQYHQLPTPNTAHFGFLDYPPGAALFHTFILTAFHADRDAILYFSQVVIIFSCVFVVTALKEWKEITVAILLCMVILSDFRATFLYCIYVDTLVGCFFAAIIMINQLSVESKQKTLLMLLPLLCYMILIKQVGFPLALFTLFVIAVTIRSHLFLLLAMLVACLLVHASWVLHYHALGVHKAFQISPHASVHSQLIVKKFIVAFFIFGKNFSRLTLSPFLTMIIILFVYFAIFKKAKLQLQAILLSLGAVLFSAGLLILYLHSYTFSEARHLASVGRYLDIYFIGWSIIFATQFVQHTAFKNTGIILLCVALMVVAMAASAVADSKRDLTPPHTDYHH